MVVWPGAAADLEPIAATSADATNAIQARRRNMSGKLKFYTYSTHEGLSPSALRATILARPMTEMQRSYLRVVLVWALTLLSLFAFQQYFS
jgi:hypothetical protein